MPDEMEPQLPLSEGELLPCGIVIDREGDWYYQGSRMHRADIVSHLCQHLGRDESSGLYIIQMGKQRCYLEVEDTPLVITGVLHTAEREGDKPEQLLLAIKHLETHEPLNPESLWIGEQNVLYCRVMGGWDPGSLPAPRLLSVGRVYSRGQRAEPILPIAWRKTFLYRIVNPG